MYSDALLKTLGVKVEMLGGVDPRASGVGRKDTEGS